MSPERIDCQRCRGHGFIAWTMTIYDDHTYEECPVCHGECTVPAPKDQPVSSLENRKD